MSIARFEEIVAWQRARALVNEVYGCGEHGSGQRDFGHRDQLRRAAVSVMTNIAEGFARESRAEFAHFLDIARASAREVQSLLYVGLDREYIDQETFARLTRDANETAFLITRLKSSLPTSKSHRR
jgi:four helix bundle protein